TCCFLDPTVPRDVVCDWLAHLVGQLRPRRNRYHAGKPFRSPAPAHRLQPSRRRNPNQTSVGTFGSVGNECLRHDRSRQYVWRDLVLQYDEGPRYQADYRMRDLSRDRQPEGARWWHGAGRKKESSPDSAGKGLRGLSQSFAIVVKGFYGRLLLQAAHRQGTARETQQRIDRAFIVHVRCAFSFIGSRSFRRGGNCGAGIPGHHGEGKLLP